MALIPVAYPKAQYRAYEPVHLYGQPADMKFICEIADRQGL